jgi:hypothetical protein
VGDLAKWQAGIKKRAETLKLRRAAERAVLQAAEAYYDGGHLEELQVLGEAIDALREARK